MYGNQLVVMRWFFVYNAKMKLIYEMNINLYSLDGGIISRISTINLTCVRLIRSLLYVSARYGLLHKL